MPPIDDLPPPPERGGSSIDDLPPPPKPESMRSHIADAVNPGTAEWLLNPVAAGVRKLTAESIRDPGAGQAGLEHFGNAAAFNYLPQLQAATEPAFAKVGDLLTGNHVADSLPDYVQRRDENIARLKQQEVDHPTASNIGTGAGMLTSAVATGGLAPEINSASLGGRALQAGVGGALYAGLSNPGDTKGEVDPLQPMARTKNAALGFATGAVLSPAMEAAQKVASGVGGYLKGFANNRAAKSLSPMKRDLDVLGREGLGEIGSQMLGSEPRFDANGARIPGDEPVIGWIPRGKETLADRAGNSATKYGKELEDTIQDLAGKQAAAGVPSADRGVIANQLRSKLIKPANGNPTIRAANDFYENLIQEYEHSGAPLLSLQALREGKLGAKDMVNWRRRPFDDVPQSEQFNRSLYGQMAEGEEQTANAIEKSLNGQSSNRVADLKGKYGRAAEASRMADQAANREAANRFISPSDYGAGMTAATVLSRGAMNPLQAAEVAGLAGAAAHHGVRVYGNQVLAKSSNALSQIVKAGGPLAKLVQENPQAAGLLIGKLRGDQTTEEGQRALPEPPAFDQFKNNPAKIDELPDGPLKAALKKRFNREPSEATPDHTDPKNLISPDDARRMFQEGN
jgi:hypothetical protein